MERRWTVKGASLPKVLANKYILYDQVSAHHVPWFARPVRSTFATRWCMTGMQGYLQCVARFPICNTLEEVLNSTNKIKEAELNEPEQNARKK